MIRICINDLTNNYPVESTCDVSNTKLIIGSSLLFDGTPSEHLDGVLEMLAFQNIYLGENTESIDRIVKGEQQLSVKTEIDVMGRSSNDIIDTGILEPGLQTTKKLVNEYTYKEPGLNKTSLRVSEIKGFDGFNKEYSYDSMGNITKIKVINALDTNEFNEFEYIYDKLSRLKEEYNPITEQTIVYTYGLNNNISTVTHYVGRKLSIIKTETYIYDVNYKDQLNEIQTVESGITTSKTVSYNSNRVPTSFLGKTLGWQGRRLTSINGTGIKYQYNDAGIRTSKEVNGETTNYYLIGDKVGLLSKGESSKLFFHYNERDMLVGFEYDKENYFYSRDLTGNITSIVDKNGLIMVEYQYDAWGRWLNQATAAKTSIGTTLLSLNPFLYKGYIYDDESGFYYLKSRYYSPEIRRFINVDSEVGDVGNLENYNLFAYCINNPVMYSDPSGKFAICTLLIMFAVSSLVTWVAGEIFGHQLVGGIGSTANGVGAISTGISLMAFGPWGIAAGIVLIGIGAATAVFGVNEVVDHFTGTNYIQSLGMSDSVYNGLYIGLNIASGVGQIAGNIGMRYASNKILNSIIQNPSKVQNYSLWQMKTYGRYTTQYIPGVMQRSTSNPGGGYTLTNKTNVSQGYIQWHPGGSRWHFGGAAYWKVTSSYNKAWRGLYLF